MTEETTTTELEPIREFVLVSTGERLPATRENAAAVILAAREMKRRLDEHIRDAERWLAEESARQGTKTFQTEYGKMTLSGGPTVEYDPQALEEALREAECPEARIREVVKTKVEYAVDKRILKQLTAANPRYAEAAEKAATTIEKPHKVDVKAPTGRSRT